MTTTVSYKRTFGASQTSGSLRADAIDRNAEYPQDMFDLLRELGIFTLPFPERYGGRESLVSACVAVEEFNRVCYNTAHLLIVQWTPFGAIAAAGNREQQDQYLPGLASVARRVFADGTAIGLVAGIKTRAVACDGGYRISGNKIWCTNAAVSISLFSRRPEKRAGKSTSSSFPRMQRGSRLDPRGQDGCTRSAVFAAVSE